MDGRLGTFRSADSFLQGIRRDGDDRVSHRAFRLTVPRSPADRSCLAEGSPACVNPG
jgi:hypothetical protein